MLSFNKLSKQNKNFSRLTGVKIEEFHEIVQKTSPKWNEFIRKKFARKRFLGEILS